MDLTADDRLTGIVSGRFDAGIRPGELVQRDIVSARITPDPRNAIAAEPGYLAEHALPRTPPALAAHTCINYRRYGSSVPFQRPFAKDGEAFDVVVDRVPTMNESGLTGATGLAGAGLACEPESADATPHRRRPLRAHFRESMPGDAWLVPYSPCRRLTLHALIDVLEAPSR